MNTGTIVPLCRVPKEQETLSRKITKQECKWWCSVFRHVSKLGGAWGVRHVLIELQIEEDSVMKQRLDSSRHLSLHTCKSDAAARFAVGRPSRSGFEVPRRLGRLQKERLAMIHKNHCERVRPIATVNSWQATTLIQINQLVIPGVGGSRVAVSPSARLSQHEAALLSLRPLVGGGGAGVTGGTGPARWCVGGETRLSKLEADTARLKEPFVPGDTTQYIAEFWVAQEQVIVQHIPVHVDKRNTAAVAHGDRVRASGRREGWLVLHAELHTSIYFTASVNEALNGKWCSEKGACRVGKDYRGMSVLRGGCLMSALARMVRFGHIHDRSNNAHNRTSQTCNR